MTDEYLEHHGIKGQKWGIRRFQNPDGTRTAAGKKREKNKEPSHEKLLKSTNAQEIYKYRGKLNDKELRDRVNRIQTEQQLEDLKKKEKRTSMGEKASNKVLQKVGEKSTEAIATGLVAFGKSSLVPVLATSATVAVASLIANSNPYSKLWLV